MINILFYFYFFLLKGTVAVGFYFLKLYCAYSTGTVCTSMLKRTPPIGAPKHVATPTAHAAASISVCRDSFSYFPWGTKKRRYKMSYIIDVEKFAAISTVWPGRSPCTWRGQWLQSWRRVRRVPPCLVAFPPPAWLSDQQPSPPASWTEKRTKRFKEIVSRDFRCLQIILISPPRGWIRTMDHI